MGKVNRPCTAKGSAKPHLGVIGGSATVQACAEVQGNKGNLSSCLISYRPWGPSWPGGRLPTAIGSTQFVHSPRLGRTTGPHQAGSVHQIPFYIKGLGVA